MIAPIRKSHICVPSGLLALFVLIVFAFFDKHRFSRKSLLHTGFGLVLPLLAVIIVCINSTRQFLSKLRYRKCIALDILVAIWTALVFLEADEAGPSEGLVFAIANAYIVWAFFVEMTLQLQNELGLTVVTAGIAFQKGTKLGHCHCLWIIPLVIYVVLFAATCYYKLKPDNIAIGCFRQTIDTLQARLKTLADRHEQDESYLHNQRKDWERLNKRVSEDFRLANKGAQELKKLQNKLANLAGSTIEEAKIAGKKVGPIKKKCKNLKKRLLKVEKGKKTAIARAYSRTVSLEEKIENLKTIVNDPPLLNRAILVLANKHGGAMSLNEVSERLGVPEFNKNEWDKWDICSLSAKDLRAAGSYVGST